MIRKQVYLAAEHERNLKALAAQRGCAEAEVIRLLEAVQEDRSGR